MKITPKTGFGGGKRPSQQGHVLRASLLCSTISARHTRSISTRIEPSNRTRRANSPYCWEGTDKIYDMEGAKEVPQQVHS